jgi:hypothetical protein
MPFVNTWLYTSMNLIFTCYQESKYINWILQVETNLWKYPVFLQLHEATLYVQYEFVNACLAMKCVLCSCSIVPQPDFLCIWYRLVQHVPMRSNMSYFPCSCSSTFFVFHSASCSSANRMSASQKPVKMCCGCHIRFNYLWLGTLAVAVLEKTIRFQIHFHNFAYYAYLHTYHFLGPQTLSYNSRTWNLSEKT